MSDENRPETDDGNKAELPVLMRLFEDLVETARQDLLEKVKVKVESIDTRRVVSQIFEKIDRFSDHDSWIEEQVANQIEWRVRQYVEEMIGEREEEIREHVRQKIAEVKIEDFVANQVIDRLKSC